MTVASDDEPKKAAARSAQAGTRRTLEDFLPIADVVIEPKQFDETDQTVAGRWHRFLHQWDNKENVIEPVLWMLLALCILFAVIIPFLGATNQPPPAAVHGELPVRHTPTPARHHQAATVVTPTTNPVPVDPAPSIIAMPSTPSLNSGFSPGTEAAGVTPTTLGPPPGGPAAGVTWNAAVKVDPTGASLTRISCVSSTFCMAVGPSGSFLWNGKGWSAPGPLPTGAPGALSCATPVFCAFGVGSGVSQWNGSTWSTVTTLVPAPAQVSSISCLSSTFCMAVSSEAGTAWEWNGSAWQPQVIVAHPGSDDSQGAVGCSAPTSCVTTVGNMAEIYNGASWSGGTQVRPADTLSTISTMSCPTTTFCTLAGSGGDISSWNGKSWSFATLDSFNFPPPGSLAFFGGRVSCSDATFCMDVESDGNTAAWDGQSWIIFSGLDKPNALETNLLTDVSCTSTSFCMATTGNGKAFEFSPS